MKNKNILAVQNLLRCLDLASLKDAEVVVNLVRAFGLVQWGDDTFGQDTVFKNSAVDQAGIYQTPAQIAEALVYLSDFKITSYLEVGVFQGGNFLFTSEYLRRFNPGIQCLGVDPTEYLNPEIRAIIEGEIFLSFKSMNSDKLAGRGYDLVMLDGDHTAAGVKKDWENVGKHAKICMLHDIQGPICPDVVAFWKALKAERPDSTVKECLKWTGKPTQGIGIIHNEKKGNKDETGSSRDAVHEKRK